LLSKICSNLLPACGSARQCQQILLIKTDNQILLLITVVNQFGRNSLHKREPLRDIPIQNETAEYLWLVARKSLENSANAKNGHARR
jgi:hypothetical protein